MITYAIRSEATGNQMPRTPDNGRDLLQLQQAAIHSATGYAKQTGSTMHIIDTETGRHILTVEPSGMVSCECCGEPIPFCCCTEEPTNADRAQRAADLIGPGIYWDGISYTDQIVDLLADLRHLCTRERLDFAELDRRAYRHYAEEIG